MHTHITREDRTLIASGLRFGDLLREIAERIAKSHVSVYREIARNSDNDGIYRSPSADKHARKRRENSKTMYRKIGNDPPLEQEIAEKIHPLVSPETIAHDLPVSTETIYAFIYRTRPDLIPKLPQRGKKRRVTVQNERKSKDGRET